MELDGLASGKYRLAGQSALLQTRTTSQTSGGPLDGVESGSTAINFTEVFPEPSLSDYLGFAYFGIIETLDEFHTVIDTSLVVAYVAGAGVGETVSDTVPTPRIRW